MKAERYQQVKKFFLAACELDESQVGTFLDEACADDVELRRELESLLKHHFPTTIIGESPDDVTAAKIARPIPPPPSEWNAAANAGSRERPKSAERFPPGTVIAGRYRILGLLGRGGMGEVVRADDLKLDQPVALKFLSRTRLDNKVWLARFHKEVRLARKVTHANVNRVYDIGEADGETFISMEYVDGEDLASLLRRIGRFSGDKALQIARQLCAGLGAAHDQGVLHRDLKPANIMIDERGQVRITDFGIAALAGDTLGESSLDGTPAFMAPELFQGKEPSERSDIYSLGVVLFELVTGRAPFDGIPPNRRHGHPMPISPSLLCPDVDPTLEQLILLCLDADPGRRPVSTHAIAAALPGRDPLSSALAAGETPSPSMVAAAGAQVGLHPKLAISYLALALIGLIAAVLLADRTFLVPQAGLSKPPAVLVDRAEEVIRSLGHPPATKGSTQGFAINRRYLQHVVTSEKRTDRWEHLPTGRPPAVFFWYRQGDRRLIPPAPFGEPALRRKLPPEPGMNSVRVDGQGRLIKFLAVPAREASPAPADESPDWTVPFGLAGLDASDFKAIDPVRAPPIYADRLVAWEGVYAENPGVPIRVEGASLGSRVVYFAVVPPWDDADDSIDGIAAVSSTLPRSFIVRFVLSMAALMGALVLARRNVRMERVDQRGARHLALFVLVMALLDWLVGQRHVAVWIEEAYSCYLGMGRATLAAAATWVFYIALEPYVRRWWPHTMVTWCRLLKGHVRDPLVGRDVLLGSLFGISMVLVLQFDTLLPSWLGLPEPAPKLPGAGYDLTELFGIRYKLGTLISVLLTSISISLVILLLMLLLRIVLRIPALAAVAFCVLLTTAFSVVSTYDTFLPWLTNAVLAIGAMLILTRVGLVAVIAGWFVSSLMMANPITSNFHAWYSPASTFTALFVALLFFFGFYTSLAGQPLLASRP